MDCQIIDYIKHEINETQDLLNKILNSKLIIANIEKITMQLVDCLKRGNKILLMGNGGSAADAQHIAAEFVSRFNFDRPGLSAIALTTDTSALTAIGNDYGFDLLFSRQIQAIGKEGDVIIAYSTSGKSQNILNALSESKKKGIITIGMTGMSSKSLMDNNSDFIIKIPSKNTAKIQEGHAVVGHILCGLVEKIIFR